MNKAFLRTNPEALERWAAAGLTDQLPFDLHEEIRDRELAQQEDAHEDELGTVENDAYERAKDDAREAIEMLLKTKYPDGRTQGHKALNAAIKEIDLLVS